MEQSHCLSARKVEGLVADGRIIVIYDDRALDLGHWIDKHPGGRLAILHMVGRDATDEINAYHFPKTLQRMKAYSIGRVQRPWTNLQPPIQGGRHRKLSDPDDIQHEAEIEEGADTSSESGVYSSVQSAVAEPMSSSNSSIGLEESVSSLATCTDTETTKLDAGQVDGAACRRRRNGLPASTSFSTKIAANLSRETYTAALEQKEIADGICNYPALDLETQQAIRSEYDALHKLVQEQGYYNCPYSEYGKEMIRYTLLFSTFLYFLHIEWYTTSAVFLGLFWQQIMFTAHDAGHRGITGNFIVDIVIGAFIADFCCGLSLGWWKASHNVHHLVTNMPEHDPDVQYIPIFSISPTYFKSIRSSFYNFTLPWTKAADVLVPYQKYAYYPIMAVARFNLYLLSWGHLLSPRAAQPGPAWWSRYLELTFLAGYWALFGYALLWRALPDWTTRVVFVLVSHAITMVLHVQINLSHWGMPTSDLGPTESFAQRQLRTTMDVDCPAWLDFLHGGLQFQAVHHLFPRMPRHNLRKCQVLVREFCAKTGIKYSCLGFVEGNKVVLGRLDEIAKMVETLVQCQMHTVDEYGQGEHSASFSH